MQLDGFAYVELTAPDPTKVEGTLDRLGFTPAATHPTKDIVRWKQGRIDLLVNREKSGHAADFARVHGASAPAMAFRVREPKRAFELAVARGAVPVDTATYALRGVGGSLLHLVDEHVFDAWRPIAGAEAAEAKNGVGLDLLDHLTHNVRRGEMRTWSGFYGKVFDFSEQKYFDIKGRETGLFSQAMIAPDGRIRIPLNESQDDRSQIEEFIREYNGEGIQHVALSTNDIYRTVEKLRSRGVVFQRTLDTYYELVDRRVPGHGEDLERLRKNEILLDGGEGEGLLLQIFTENLFGPIFVEVIQRKGNEGFGNGNFQALFESIELDQIRRGVLA